MNKTLSENSKNTKDRLQLCMEKIDHLNGKDPNSIEVKNKKVAIEILYSRRMKDKLLEYDALADELLIIAAAAQHIMRWKIKRKDFSQDRKGYLKWRTKLNKFHCDEIGIIMGDCHYPDAQIKEVQGYLLKRNLKNNKGTQIIEDIACLVFLEFYFDDLIAKTSFDQIVSIIEKTWLKMSEKAQSMALLMSYSQQGQKVIAEAKL